MKLMLSHFSYKTKKTLVPTYFAHPILAHKENNQHNISSPKPGEGIEEGRKCKHEEWVR